MPKKIFYISISILVVLSLVFFASRLWNTNDCEDTTTKLGDGKSNYLEIVKESYPDLLEHWETIDEITLRYIKTAGDLRSSFNDPFSFIFKNMSFETIIKI